MRPAWSPRQPVQHHTHQGNVYAFIRDLVPYFGTRKRYGLKNLRKKKWDKKKRKTGNVTRWRNQDAPERNQSSIPGGHGSWCTACMRPPIWGLYPGSPSSRRSPPELPRGPQREGLRGREGRGPRSRGPKVPRPRAAQPLPPVSIAAETSRRVLEAPPRDVGGWGWARRGLPEAQEA